jgi:cobalt transporter subunit CbtA
MQTFRTLALVALLAGTLAGLAMAAGQHLAAVPLIQAAEAFEAAAPPADGHDHDHAAWAPRDGLERAAFTALADVGAGIGFALLLAAAFVVRGGGVGWRQGILWGLAGFGVFIVAPFLGLPPELPGTPSAGVSARQLWWLLTVLATAGGLALIARRASAVSVIAGVLLVLAPHLIGAPHPHEGDSLVPAALSRNFVVAVTLTAFVFWLLLGAVAGHLYDRLTDGQGLRPAAEGR